MTWALVVMLLSAAGRFEQEPPVRAEHLEFDPRSGQWTEIAPPQPGTAEGDLTLIRRQLSDDDFSAAVRAARRWLKNYGGSHALARAARLCLAQGLLGIRDHYKAHEICAELLAQGTSDRIGADAAEMEFIIADVFLSGTRRKWLGLPLLPGEETAIEILDSLSRLHSPPRIAEYALKREGDYYFGRGEFDLADDEYAKLLSGFPDSPYVPWITLRRAQAALARFPGTRFDDAALVEAEERFLRYRQQYPARAEAEKVDLILEDIRNTRARKEYETGRWYQKVGQAQAARFYYRSVVENWSGTPAAIQAQTHLDAAEAGAAGSEP